MLSLWKSNQEAAKQYLTGLVISNYIPLSSVGDIPLPLHEHVRKAEIAHREFQAKQALDSARAAKEYAEKTAPVVALAAAKAKAEQEEMVATVERLHGMDRLIFLAGLPPADRDRLATASERREVITLREDCVLTSAARQLLGCTLGEINRWEADGRLPCLYFKRIQTGWGSVEARFWNRSQLAIVQDQLETWREQDRTRRRFKRMGMKVVKLRVPRAHAKASAN